MSNWETTEEEAAQHTPHPANVHSEHVAPTPDGFDPELSFNTDDGSNHEQFEDVQPKKKSGPNPKVVLAILVLVTAGFLGYMGLTLYKKLAPRAAAPIAVQEQRTTIDVPGLPAPADSVVVVNTQTSPAGDKPATVDVTVSTAAPATAVVPVQPEPATAAAPGAAVPLNQPVTQQAQTVVTVATPPPVAAAAVPVAAIDRSAEQALGSKIDAQDRRLSAIEGSIDKLTKTVNGLPAKSAATTTVASAKPAAPARIHGTAPARTAKVAKPMIEEGPVESASVTSLILRGVYPPQGENRQAWVMDPKTGSLMVVTAGSSVNEAKVIRVESDRVITNRGVIQ